MKDTCRACNAKVEWVKVGGEEIPLDFELTIVVVGDVVPKIVRGRRCHHDTCVAAVAWRGRLHESPADTPSPPPESGEMASFLRARERGEVADA